MALNMATVTFDCTDPARLAGWWAAQFGGEVQDVMPGEFILVARSPGPQLGFQRVPDPTPGKNRVHLDFATDDVEGEVSRLVAAGATETGRHNIGDFGWVVLADPDGNAFCVAGG
ncbi:MAG TPA: VOC family protein [Mycobacterium sp.]|nr:VOC family protein [Mycobacterium sp.]